MNYMKKKFKLNQDVIVTVNKKEHKLAKLISKTVKNKRNVFNVIFENGSQMLYLPVDAENESMYINSKLTDKIIPQCTKNNLDKVKVIVEDDNIYLPDLNSL